MPVSRRYSPEWAPGDSAAIGMDFSPIIPSGVGIASGSLVIYTNSVTPAPATDFATAPCQIEDRVIYSVITGGTGGTDYRLIWVVYDTLGQRWGRSALMLCAPTS